MSYQKQTWVDNDPSKPLSAERLNHMEDGIESAQATAEGAQATAASKLGLSDVQENFSASSDYPVKNSTLTKYTHGVNYQQLGTIVSGGMTTSGEAYANCCSITINVVPGNEYLVTGQHINNSIPLYMFLDSNNNIITPTFTNVPGHSNIYTDYKVVAPSNASKMIVQAEIQSAPQSNVQPNRLYIRQPISLFNIENQYLLDLINSKADKELKWESTEFTVIYPGSFNGSYNPIRINEGGEGYAVINVTGGQKYKVSGEQRGTTAPMVMFTDDNGFLIHWVNAPQLYVPTIDQEVTVPYGATKMYVQSGRNTINIKVGVDPSVDPEPQTVPFEKLDDDVKGSIYSKITYPLIKGRYRSANLESDAYWRTFNKWFILTGKYFVFQHYNTTEEERAETYIVAYYDEAGVFISFVEMQNNWGVVITPPDNAKYIRFSFRKSPATSADYTDAIYWDRYILGLKQISINEETYDLAEPLPLSTALTTKGLFKKVDYDLQIGIWRTNGTVESIVYGRSTYNYYKIVGKSIGYYHESSEADLYEMCTIYFYDKDFNYISASGAWRFAFTVSNIPANAVYVRFNFRHSNAQSGYNNTPYDDTKITRYVIGIELGQCVTDKYKKSIDRGLTFGYKVAALGNIPYLNFLHISDTHGSINALNAIKIFNKLKKDGYCHFMMHTGDICASYPRDNTKESFLNHMSEASGDILLTAGNHDVGSTNVAVSYCYTDAEYHDEILSYMLNRTTVTNNPEGKNYYYKDFTDNKIRFIVLYEYETDFELDPNDPTKLKYIRGNNAYSQAQIDWLITALSTLPSGYGVIIAKHEPLNIRGTTDNSFNSLPLQGHRSGQGYVSSDMIPDIVQAFIDKTTINRTYAQTGGIVTTLVANANFANTNGEFICYVDGHTHADGVSFLADYPEQLELNIACDNFHYLHGNDSKNIQGTLLQDVLNYVSVDPNKGIIHILRIGNDFSSQASRRDFMSIKYRRAQQ